MVNGNPITDEWKSAHGKWFYLDTDGNMVTDKLIEDVNGPIYHVNKYGAMVTETWKAVAFEEGDEALVRDAEYWWMYFGADGKAYKCKLSGKYVIRDIKGKKYAFDENGHMLYGWIDKVSDWQEKYMKRLVKEYVTVLTDESRLASDKFWELMNGRYEGLLRYGDN